MFAVNINHNCSYLELTVCVAKSCVFFMQVGVDVYQFNLPFTPTLVYLDSFYVINKTLLLNININYKLAILFLTNTVWPPVIATVGKYKLQEFNSLLIKLPIQNFLWITLSFMVCLYIFILVELILLALIFVNT